ncbi:aminoglycoside adenylyltransferase domain-containing protein [Nocardia sp. NPDC002869]|uniref:aminoglycoside adenylyltransferase domain-containing protein n=1 Tax=Nocardia sp. NPDC002869 TaxID=3161032 RepID=UPI00398D14DD
MPRPRCSDLSDDPPRPARAGPPLEPRPPARSGASVTTPIPLSSLRTTSCTTKGPCGVRSTQRRALSRSAIPRPGVDGDERNAVLTPARMWITAETGAVVSKTEAAQRPAARAPARTPRCCAARGTAISVRRWMIGPGTGTRWRRSCDMPPRGSRPPRSPAGVQH